ncbi:MAG: S41 family peptidase [Dysgonomonas sp.]
MKKSILVLSLLLLSILTRCQQPYVNTSLNLDMEKIIPGKELPDGWMVWGKGYNVVKDAEVLHKGQYSIAISPSDSSDMAFGCAAYSIPAQYKGEEIELKAYIKMEDVRDGRIGLLLRIDGTSGSLAFDNMQSKDIKGTADWTQYSVKVQYPKGAKTIYVGAMLVGNGKIWADDFEILIDGKDIRYIEPVAPEQHKADKDNDFSNGSTTNEIDLTPEMTGYLKNLGLIWGFVKYYHPSIAKGEYNWDNELFRHLPTILAASNNKERDKLVYEWIESLGEFEVSEANTVPSEDVKLAPDLAWIDNSGFDSELVSLLNKIKSGKREGEHYYIASMPQVGNPVFANERPYGNMKYSDAGLRLLSLYRYWNMIQYFFPYKHLIEEDWKDVLAEFVPRFVNASDELEYKLATLELIGRVHDTHANIWGGDYVLNKFKGVNSAPYKVAFVEDKAIVTNFLNDEKAKESALQIGDVITHINGKDVNQIIKEQQKYSPASNYPTQLRDIARDLLKTNDSIIQVKYLRDNKAAISSIRTYAPHIVNVYKNFAPDSCFRMINKDVAYIYPGKMKNDYLQNIMTAAAETKGIVIDFRCYPSDFLPFTLGARLVEKNAEFVKFTRAQINYPGCFVMSEPLKIPADPANHYKGKIVVIVNEETQSSAEYQTMAFQAGPRTTVIGSTTAAADGNVSRIILPGNIFTMISGIGVYYPDGRETQRIGIVPDIEIKPTLKGIKEGKDELLDKAIEIINKD